ncbi:MAG: ABC transporter ATP-binding protein, partial [Thermomicrobia bacterium]|nr:ABC transporter ATP-binding protein [Thermomicrobia bacterium]
MGRIAFDHVTKKYGDVVAVKDISLEAADGEFLVLVGPSGCGKTSALRCLAGLEEVTDGTLYISDRDVTMLPPKDRDVAMVFQNYALYPHMDVYGNLAFALRLRKQAMAAAGADKPNEAANGNGAKGLIG